MPLDCACAPSDNSDSKKAGISWIVASKVTSGQCAGDPVSLASGPVGRLQRWDSGYSLPTRQGPGRAVLPHPAPRLVLALVRAPDLMRSIGDRPQRVLLVLALSAVSATSFVYRRRISVGAFAT